MRRMFAILLTLGIVSLASLLLAPMEVLQPPGLHMAALQFRALTLIQPLVLLVAFVATGCWAAPKVGLEAPLVRALIERRPVADVLRRQIGPALAVGIAVALLLLLYGWATADAFRGSVAASFDIPLLPKLLYGGIAEELLTRWGLMSLFAWIAWRVSGRIDPVPAWCFWLAALLAAALFGAGHLPLLYALMPAPPTWLVLAVLAGNLLPGLLFGLLFWRRGLEAAMIAHATAHLVSTVAGGVLQ